MDWKIYIYNEKTHPPIPAGGILGQMGLVGLQYNGTRTTNSPTFECLEMIRKEVGAKTITIHSIDLVEKEISMHFYLSNF